MRLRIQSCTAMVLVTLLLTACGRPTTTASHSAEIGQLFGKRVAVTDMTSVEEGVFCRIYTGYDLIILELHAGKYRDWEWSHFGPDQRLKYPVSWTYRSEGPHITLEGLDSYHANSWTFRKVNEITTLWDDDAIKSWQAERKLYGVVLFPAPASGDAI